MKTFKYNSACDAEKHTDKPYEFVLHVARCKICQEKLSPEILKSLEPRLTELKTKVAATAKVQAVGETKAPLSQPEDKQKVPPQVKAPESKSKQPVIKLPSEKVDQPVDDIEARISNSPTIKSLGDSISKLGEGIDMILGMGGALAKKDAKAVEGEPVTEIAPTKGESSPVLEGEHITMSSERLQEAQQMAEEKGGDSQIIEGASPQKNEQPILDPLPGVPDLEDPKAIKAMEHYLKQQKQKLGMKEEPPGTEAPSTEAPTEKGGGGFLGEATGLAGTVLKIISALPKKGEGGGMQEITGELFKGWIASLTNKPDPFELFFKGAEFYKNLTGGDGNKVEMATFQDGMKMSNTVLGNAIKVLRGGKGDIVSPEPLADDIDKRIDSRIQRAMSKTKTEEESLE